MKPLLNPIKDHHITGGPGGLQPVAGAWADKGSVVSGAACPRLLSMACPVETKGKSIDKGRFVPGEIVLFIVFIGYK